MPIVCGSGPANHRRRRHRHAKGPRVPTIAEAVGHLHRNIIGPRRAVLVRQRGEVGVHLAHGALGSPGHWSRSQ